MRRILLLLTIFALSGVAFQHPAESFGSSFLRQSQITNTTENIAAVSTAITLASPSENITIKTDPAAAVIYVDFAGGTATAADFRIDPGAAFTLSGTKMKTFNYIGATATGTVSVCAN
jgi:hypothetical protein